MAPGRKVAPISTPCLSISVKFHDAHLAVPESRTQSITSRPHIK